MNPRDESERKEWGRRGRRLLELSELSFELALDGLPRFAPCEVRLQGVVARFAVASDIERLEREIADAFLVRVRGLSEALLNELGTMDWRTGARTIAAIEQAIGCTLAVPPDDIEMLTKLPQLRNVIAHADGNVDTKVLKKLPEMTGPDVWMGRAEVRQWFSLLHRLFASISNA